MATVSTLGESRSSSPRPRFSLRLLLVVVMIVAVGLGVFRYLQPSLLPDEHVARSIKLGMSDREVFKRLGGASDINPSNANITYTFRVASPEGFEPNYVSVEFGPDWRVNWLKRTGRIAFVFPE